VGDEVEPYTAHLARMEFVEVGVSEARVDHGHAGEPSFAALNGVDHRRVVGPMTARLDENGPAQAESFLEAEEIVDA